MSIKKNKLGLALATLLLAMGALTGCHGAKASSGFEIPQEFDESRNIELTFWAKMIPTKPRQPFITKL